MAETQNNKERKIEMVSINLLWLLWPVLGIPAGLISANKVYAEDAGNVNRNPDTAMTFIVVAGFFPLVAAAFICWLIFRKSAWLLPAYRQEQYRLREDQETDRTTELRKQINDMHTEIGIAPVDWTDKTMETGK